MDSQKILVETPQKKNPIPNPRPPIGTKNLSNLIEGLTFFDYSVFIESEDKYFLQPLVYSSDLVSQTRYPSRYLQTSPYYGYTWVRALN